MGDLEWEMAKEWIRSTSIVPMNGKAFELSVDLFDFAQSLRDGVILCQVANKLKPFSVRDVSIVQNVNMHMFLCLRNIRAFLKACTEDFKLDQDDLFAANELYDVSNFQSVIRALSLLSHTYEAKTLCKLKPFPPQDYKPQQSEQEEEDIYGTLPDILEKKEPDYYSYQDDEENIYDHVPSGEKIYDDIVQCTGNRPLSSPSVDKTDKRGYIINEILETEDNYLKALKVMVEMYIRPLKGYMSAYDKDIIFMNTEQIYVLHTSFTRELTIRDSKAKIRLNFESFEKYKDKFLIYALYCTGLPDAQQHTLELSKDSAFREKVESCNKKAERKFPLQEQLVVPFQRILKYPLLLRDLNKQTPAGHEEKQSVEKAFEIMDDIAKYINEFKRDHENVKLMAQIENSVRYDLHGQGVKLTQFGRHMKNGELQVKFDSNDKKVTRRYAFLFDHSMLLCKSRGDTYDVKEVFDLQKFKIGDIPSVGKGKFSQGWSMQAHVTDGVSEAKNCTMFAKTQQDKITWVSEVSKCIEAVTLSEWQGKLDNHQLELKTFDTPQSCQVCRKLLRGQISQGYKCAMPGCNLYIHKECLIRCPKCNPIKPPKPQPTVHLRPIEARRITRQHTIPSPPTHPTRSLSPSGNNTNDLQNYSWFAGVMSRDQASQKLRPQCDGAFLIRESPNQPGLAISIQYRTETKHIKIGKLNGRYYLTDPKQFTSIPDLVMYYKNNSLGCSFPSLPTKLTTGVAKAKRTMKAKFDWLARNVEELSLRAGQEVNVLNDKDNWWYGESNGKVGFFPNNYVE